MANKQLSTEDVTLRQKDDIDLAMGSSIDDGNILLSKDFDVSELEVVTGQNALDYANQLAFMEEWVEIVVQKGPEEHAPMVVSPGVNGEFVDIPVHTPVQVRRKFLNVLLTTIRESLRTEVQNMDNGDRHNLLRSSRTLRHNVTVIKDSAKGMKWFSEQRAAA